MLTALPDAGSWIIWEWPSAIHFRDRAGLAEIAPVAIPITLPSDPEAGTLALTWTSGSATKTATEASNGTLSGHGSGYRVGRQVVLYLAANFPDAGTQVGYQYQPLATVTEVLAPTMTGSEMAVTLSQAARPGSVRVRWDVHRQSAALAKQQTAVGRYYGTGAVTVAPPSFTQG